MKWPSGEPTLFPISFRFKLGNLKWGSCLTWQGKCSLASSPKFTDWIIKHADRIQLLPDDSSDNTIGSGLDSTDENLVESGDRFILYMN
ncbi:hypothetical protein CsSME_00046227 [Camellia sinensis var. sinensis]